MLIPGSLFVFRRVAELFLLRAILETTVRRRFDWDVKLAALPVPTLVYHVTAIISGIIMATTK